jgi:hypothetical protein
MSVKMEVKVPEKKLSSLEANSEGDDEDDTLKHSEVEEELPPFPTLGVKLSVFFKFIEDNGGKDAFLKKPFVKEPLTTTDVCNKFLKPITSEKQQSYCEYLQDQNSPDVGEATVFISHAWKYIFAEVVDALEHHFLSSQPDIYIWFDLFSNNQVRASGNGSISVEQSHSFYESVVLVGNILCC